MNDKGDVSPMKASQTKAVEFVVNEIVDHGAVNDKKLYCVRWCVYKEKKNATKPGDRLSDHFIEAFWHGQNCWKRPRQK